jgi:hypothetical protein
VKQKSKNELQQVQGCISLPAKKGAAIRPARSSSYFFIAGKAKKLLDGCLAKRVPFARYISSYARCCWHSTKGKEREPFTQQWPSAFGMCERRGYSQSKIRCTKMFLKARVCVRAHFYLRNAFLGEEI